MGANTAQLETALVNADKAGDKDAATKLAGEIMRLRNTPTETATSSGPDWGNYYAGIEGLNDRVKPEQAAAFDRTTKVAGADGVMESINQAYWQNHLNGLPTNSITSNWPTVRNTIGKEIFGRTGETSEKNLYSMTGAHLKDTEVLRKLEYQNAGPVERFKMMMDSFPKHFGENASTVTETALKPGLDVKQLPDLPNVPSMGLENPALVGAIWNSFVKPTVEGATSQLGLATLGFGGMLSGAKAAGVPLAEGTMSLVQGLFAAAMAHQSVKQAPETLKVLHDPNATFQQKAEAVGNEVTPMLFGTVAAVDSAMGFYSAKEQPKVMNRVLKATTPEQVAEVLREEAKKVTTQNHADALNEAASAVEELKLPEKISSAAIKLPDGTIKQGVDHGSIRMANRDIKLDGEEGFVTNTGRFVDRKEGMKVASEADQLSLPLPKGDELHSHMVEYMAPEVKPSNFGIAARVTEARAEEGNIAAVDAGEGRGVETLIEEGRKALREGANPNEIIERFNRTKQLSGLDMATVRAKGEQLAKAARDAEEKFGINSPEYKAAAQADSDWIKKIKPLQTESSDIFRAQQGETDLDTGSFHALQREFVSITGKDFTPDQAKKAQRVAQEVRKSEQAAQEATQKVMDAIKSQNGEKGQTAKAKLIEGLAKQAAAARERIKKRLAEGRSASGLDPEDLADHAIIGADYIAKGIVKFSDWSEAMVKDLGERIRPFLKDIYAQSKKSHGEFEKAALDQVSLVWGKAKDYLDRGDTNFDDIRTKISTDTGIPVDEVTRLLTEPKGVRNLTDEMYARMSEQRKLVTKAHAWIKNQSMPGWQRVIKALPSAFFKIATFGHGTVGMITHSGVNMFSPPRWSSYWRNFGRQFRLFGLFDRGAYHERMMQSLIRDPNYITAKRAGLKVDPTRFTDDYQNNWVGPWLQEIGLRGNRGFDALKLYRMDRFNQEWAKMPASLRTQDMAKLVADGINHESGAVKMQFRDWANYSFFAPKLEASRWAWLIGDPAKAAKTFKEWGSASSEEKQFAVQQVKEKATIAGVYLTMLAANDGLLAASGSSQRINFTDPKKGDFLTFKGGQHTLAIISPMLGVVRVLANILHDSAGKREKYENRESRAASIETDVGDYARGKLSPFAGIGTDIITQSDFQRRPLPFSEDKVPARLRREGMDRYTYGEYIGEHVAPIPVEEFVREVWKQQGMTESDIDHWLKALASAVVTGGTGARLREELPARQPRYSNR